MTAPETGMDPVDVDAYAVMRAVADECGVSGEELAELLAEARKHIGYADACRAVTEEIRLDDRARRFWAFMRRNTWVRPC